MNSGGHAADGVQQRCRDVLDAAKRPARLLVERCLELGRRAFGDLATAVDDGDPVGELVGLIDV